MGLNAEFAEYVLKTLIALGALELRLHLNKKSPTNPVRFNEDIQPFFFTIWALIYGNPLL